MLMGTLMRSHLAVVSPCQHFFPALDDYRIGIRGGNVLYLVLYSLSFLLYLLLFL